jgi:hypothetical protein
MQFKAHCAAQVSTNGSNYVLIRFDPDDSHLTGKISKELGELEIGEVYEVTIRKVSRE